MKFKDRPLEQLFRLRSEARREIRRLQQFDFEIRQEINERNGVTNTPERYASERKGLKTSEVVAIANYAKEAHDPAQWVAYIENLINKRKQLTTPENESTI